MPEVPSNSYMIYMNQAIKSLVKEALKVSVRKPASICFISKNLIWQNTAEKLRTKWQDTDYIVPPFIISSITTQCNLKCIGCYDKCYSSQQQCKEPLLTKRWLEIFTEAKDLGISFILIAGGEPFTQFELLKGLEKIPQIIFPIFTNGTYLDEKSISLLDKCRNLIPIISLEGYEKETDMRRGTGIYETVMNSMNLLNEQSIFFGVSITVNRDNFSQVTEPDFVLHLLNQGCKIMFYVEYVPIDESTIDLEITETQRNQLESILLEHRKQYSALFISFPGDETQFGGCLSSGRGFVHINAYGDLEPCPFSPYSDTNLKDFALKDALQSKFLKSIRESKEHLDETKHGCALFHKKDWVQSLLK